MQDEFRGLSPQPLWDPGSASQLAGAPQWAAIEGKVLLQGVSTARVLAPVWPPPWHPCGNPGVPVQGASPVLSSSAFSWFSSLFLIFSNNFFPCCFLFLLFFIPFFFSFCLLASFAFSPIFLPFAALPFLPPQPPYSLYLLLPHLSPSYSPPFSRFHFLCVSSGLRFLFFLFLRCVPLFLCFLLFLSLPKLGSKGPGVCRTGCLSPLPHHHLQNTFMI